MLNVVKFTRVYAGQRGIALIYCDINQSLYPRLTAARLSWITLGSQVS